MEHFVVSARKYRPQSFEDVVGQQAITNTLLHAIKNDHLAQALLFTGPRGVGKTTCARILAKRINQDENTKEGEDFAFNIFELDAASNNSVDDIRSLIDQVRIPPQVGKYKVYIIDEVHMLSQAAFNAFLKTLEEPPKHAIFILATTEKHKIIPTILSRCQIFDFKRITVFDIKEYLAKIAKKEGVNAEDDALHIIAQKADGALRDALSIYDRVVSYSGKELTRTAVAENLNVLDYETYFVSTDLILENKIPDLLVHFNDILSRGFDGQHYIAGLASHFRDLLVCKNQETIALLEVGEETKARYFEQSQKCSTTFLMRGIELANECDFHYKNSRNQRLLVELCLMQLASITFSPTSRQTGDEKKKPEPFIIPSANFKVNGTSKLPEKPAASVDKQTSTPKKEYQPTEENTIGVSEVNGSKSTEKVENQANHQSHTGDSDKLESTDQKTRQSTQATPKTEISIEGKKPTSGLSLKSIRKKREMLARQNEVRGASVVEANDPYTVTDVQNAWDEYAKHLKKHGNKILASILETDLPSVADGKIRVKMPNQTMKLDLERAQGQLMGFIRKKINNTHIELEIEVDETAEKKYAYTPKEKYEKLKEKNPLIEKLRKEFDLDI